MSINPGFEGSKFKMDSGFLSERVGEMSSVELVLALIIGAATAWVAWVRTLPTFEKVILDPPNFLGRTRLGPAQYSIPNSLIFVVTIIVSKTFL